MQGGAEVLPPFAAAFSWGAWQFSGHRKWRFGGFHCGNTRKIKSMEQLWKVYGTSMGNL